MKKKKIGDIVAIAKGRKAQKVFEEKLPNAVRYIQIEDLRTDNKIQYTADTNGIFVSGSDLCIAWDGANAGTVGYGLSGMIGSTIARLCINDSEIYTPYIGHFLQSKFNILNGRTTGTTIPHVERRRLEELEFLYRPLSEQRRIADILDKADAIRRKRQQSLKLTDDLVKSQFVEMFGGGEHFPQKQLHEVALISGGLTKNASKRVNYELKIPYLRVANVFFNRLDLTEVLTLSVHPNELGKGLLQAGDLLFVEGNGSIEQVGRVAIWDGSIQPCVHQNHLIKVRFNPGVMNPRFAMFFFMGDAGRAQIMGKAVSTSGLHTLSVNKIETLSIPLPPIELQNQFAAFVEQADKSKFAMQNQLSEIEKLSSALKQTFFA